MPWKILFEYSIQYGIAAIIAAVLLYFLWRIIKSFLSGLKEDRNNYMKIIGQQAVTQDNHIYHLDESVKEQSRVIAQQGERFSSGVDKICSSLESQTDILKAVIKKND